LAIARIDSDGLGFMADGTDGNGQKFEKNFRLTPGEQCVVYRKTGWESMGCIKPLHQFLADAEFHEPPTLEEPVVEWNVPGATTSRLETAFVMDPGASATNMYNTMDHAAAVVGSAMGNVLKGDASDAMTLPHEDDGPRYGGSAVAAAR